MHKPKYSFTRAESIEGFLKSNRASTDALNALQRWVGAGDRSYDVVTDKDDELVVILQFEEDDDKAGEDLNAACHQAGIERTFIESN